MPFTAWAARSMAARAGELDGIEGLGAEALACYRDVRAGITAL